MRQYIRSSETYLDTCCVSKTSEVSVEKVSTRHARVRAPRLAFEWLVRNVGLRFVYYNSAGLHHPAHLVDCDLNVVQRIAFDGHNVSEITRANCSQALLHA